MSKEEHKEIMENGDKKVYSVNYFLMMQGMGSPNERSYGLVEASSSEEARDIVAMQEYPEDTMYGPNNSYSTRDFFRGCLSAKEVYGE